MSLWLWFLCVMSSVDVSWVCALDGCALGDCDGGVLVSCVLIHECAGFSLW